METATPRDMSDMQRMGKRQQFRRNFALPTNLAFVALAMNTWEGLLAGTAGALANGGSAGLIWTYLASFICFGAVILSLAEMASMCPTSGGQYHWASEFAPRQWQKPISFFTGWLSVLSWQCGTAGVYLLDGCAVQAIATLTHLDYTAPPYQAYFIMVGLITFGAVFNTILAKHLPAMEGMFLLSHVLVFVLITLTLGILAPKVTAAEVFTIFYSKSGYSNIALSTLLGQTAAIWTLLGSDTSAHMAEETKNASINVPRSIVYSYLLNGILGFSILIIYLFSLSNVEEALGSPAGSLGFPYMQVFVSATRSNGFGAALASLVVAIGFSGGTTLFASTSRQTFAFARDNGLPFSSWLSYVNPKYLVPTRSIFVTWNFTVLLGLIRIGSTTAFNAIISLQVLALLLTYGIAIACLLSRKLGQGQLPPSPWSMGIASLPLNIVALACCIWIAIWCCFPTMLPVTASTFNWAPIMFAGVMLLASVYYWVVGRKNYEGPVVKVSTS
ncbi:amino acid transporter [Myriangium duriaei CBS 260.36]|uniref:Amino acid transporter n=1 Tax=Myriangium duriaei CBS 260.36 TaxID=1168546 RepID=A0A9P4J1R3_9PEZI|nr:amino acid transporter [Myriangium duriaei CBS 260.36]